MTLPLKTNLPDMEYKLKSLPLNAAAVTVHDTNLIASGPCTLFVGVGGDVKVTTLGGQAVTFKNVASGSFMPVVVTQVFDTGTTATNMLALY